MAPEHRLQEMAELKSPFILMFLGQGNVYLSYNNLNHKSISMKKP